ncbi:MAG: DNA ligase [Rubrivivax sp.]|nr:DNA ligase [Rubrivivax sp.]
MNLQRRHFCLAAATALTGLATDLQAAPPPLMQARDAAAGAIDPTGFLVSEKLDGVRAHWDGRQLRFRGGGLIAAPAWFTAALPAQPLDGELWAGCGGFEQASGTSRRAAPDDAAWRALRYGLFDLPGDPRPFAERAQALAGLASRVQRPFVHAVAQQTLPDAAALARRLDEVLRAGGEGLMLHRAAALWQPGRSADLLKLKPQADAEAVVLGHLPGRGRHEGRMGALRVQLPDGREFRLGTGFTDAERAAPPPVGTRVSFRYQGLTDDGLPRFARYWRVREAD